MMTAELIKRAMDTMSRNAMEREVNPALVVNADQYRTLFGSNAPEIYTVEGTKVYLKKPAMSGVPITQASQFFNAGGSWARPGARGAGGGGGIGGGAIVIGAGGGGGSR